MLKLDENFVTFEACSSDLNFFFDNLNHRICTVRKNGVMGINAKGIQEKDSVSFRISDEGPIQLLRFSPNSEVVAIKRDKSAIDFVFLSDTSLPFVRQCCKNYDAQLLGVQWITDTQLIFITEQGIELYALSAKKRLLKLVKYFNIAVSWFTSYTSLQLIFVSNGINNSTLNPFMIQSNLIHRLSKFDVEFESLSFRSKLLDKDVTIGLIYDRLTILVFKNGEKESLTECINVYEYSPNNFNTKPQLTKKLKLNLCGFLGIHIIDNTIIVHHKKTKSSLVFDVGLTKNETDLQQIEEILPLCITNVEISKSSFFYENYEFFLYGSTTAIFLPNFVANIRLGIFTKINLIVNQIPNYIKDSTCLLDFLSKRNNAEDIFLKVFKNCLIAKSINNTKICNIFQQLLESNINNTSQTTPKSSNLKSNLLPESKTQMQIDNSKILREVFDPLRDCQKMDKEFLSYLVLEFFLIAKRIKISLENYLPEFLLRVLVDAKQFNKLQQLLQYGVINDSKFLAFELISLAKDYEPLYQLAMDMLARRENIEQICEMLINQGKIIEAVRCVGMENNHKANFFLDKKLCLKLLEGAWKTNNRQIMYTVFTHLQNVQKIKYLDGTYEEFKKYVLDFNLLYKEEEIEEAEKRFRLARISSANEEVEENDNNKSSSIKNASENSSDEHYSDCTENLIV